MYIYICIYIYIYIYGVSSKIFNFVYLGNDLRRLIESSANINKENSYKLVYLFLDNMQLYEYSIL